MYIYIYICKGTQLCTTMLLFSAPSTTTVYPTFLVQTGTTAPTTTILPLSPTSTVLPLSTTTELYPSTTVVPPVEFDINALSKIFINDVEITNATCILETVYIPKSTPCLQIFSPTAYVETTPGATNCPTFPDIEYNVVCNTTRAKFKDLEAETEEIIRKLTVKPETTAAYQNKFKCAEDSRPSAQTMGSSMGVIFILVPALLVIISDLPRFYQFVKRVCKAIKKKRRIRLVTLPKLRKVYSVNTSLPPKPGLFSGIVPIYSSEITGVEEIKTLPIHTLPTDPEPIQ